MRQYGQRELVSDLPAGLTVGVMLVPQGMAYALIAGLPVVYGLYAALVPTLVYALMGTSRQLSVGPVAMDSLLVASGLAGLAMVETQRYVELALLLALMTGAIQFALGTLRMGFLSDFLSRPVISGFTSAAALIIGLNQLPNLLGISMLQSAKIHLLLGSAWTHLEEVHWPTLAVSVLAMVLILGLRRVAPKIPSGLAVLVLGIGAVATGMVKTRTVGAVPAGLPSFHIPEFTLQDIQTLLPVAATLALIAFMEGFSVAKAVAQRRGDHKVDANQELRALGMGNVLGSMFGAFPTTGGFSRTAVNDRAGAATPMSSIIAAGVVAVSLTLLTGVFQFLPKAVLGAIIAVAVAGLVDVAYFKKLWASHRDEALLMIATFAVTAFGGMVTGIATGVALSLFLTLYKISRPHTAELGWIGGVYRNLNRFPQAQKAKGQLIVRYDGPLNYASQSHFQEFILARMDIREKEGDPIHRVVLNAKSIPYLDASAASMLEQLLDEFEKRGVQLHWAGAIGPVRDGLKKAGLMHRIGEQNFHAELAVAMGEIDPDAEKRNIALQTFKTSTPPTPTPHEH